MDIRIKITGFSPLLMHNVQLVDPDNPYVKEIATYSGKRKKTEEDRREMERLEWFGGLYLDDDRQVVLPTANIRKSFINAGKATKQGTQVGRALSFQNLRVPLEYDDTKDIDILFKDDRFHNRSAVGIGQKKIIRVRPQFPSWSVVAEALLLDDVMDVDDLRRVAERAGVAEGIGDNRINGYGRFQVEVEELTE